MNKTAKFIKKMGEFHGDVRLYKLSEPIEYGYDWDAEKPEGTTEYVIVSIADALFSGPEAYIFPADENGKIIGWGELDGLQHGSISHEKVLRDAGFAVS